MDRLKIQCTNQQKWIRQAFFTSHFIRTGHAGICIPVSCKYGVGLRRVRLTKQWVKPIKTVIA